MSTPQPWPTGAGRTPLLLLPPLLLAGLSVFHPQPDVTVTSLLDVSTWFALFHVIQLVLAGLVGLSVVLLADALGRAGTWAVRLGVGTFLVFFSAYDAVAGIGTGLALRSARDLPTDQQEGIFSVVKDWPGLDTPFALGIVGTAGWVLAVGALAVAARSQGAPRRVWVLLALAAAALLGGHPFPAGTIAFGSLFVAIALHLRVTRPSTAPADAHLEMRS